MNAAGAVVGVGGIAARHVAFVTALDHGNGPLGIALGKSVADDPAHGSAYFGAFAGELHGGLVQTLHRHDRTCRLTDDAADRSAGKSRSRDRGIVDAIADSQRGVRRTGDAARHREDVAAGDDLAEVVAANDVSLGQTADASDLQSLRDIGFGDRFGRHRNVTSIGAELDLDIRVTPCDAADIVVGKSSAISYRTVIVAIADKSAGEGTGGAASDHATQINAGTAIVEIATEITRRRNIAVIVAIDDNIFIHSANSSHVVGHQ